MLTVLSTATVLACSALHVEVLRPAQVMACELRDRAEGRQSCARRDDAVRALFEAEDAQVAGLLFSLSARTDEATVLRALRRYDSRELPEIRCDNRRIGGGRRWVVPVRSTANGGFPVLEVRFVDGKVASARWQPTSSLMFNAAYIAVAGPGWVPPPESGP